MSVDDSKHICKRMLDVNGVSIEHNHFKSWPDWEVPFDDSMRGFQELIKGCASYVIDESAKPDPLKLLVHCKAGIGRTGTTLSLVNAVIQLQL